MDVLPQNQLTDIIRQIAFHNAASYAIRSYQIPLIPSKAADLIVALEAQSVYAAAGYGPEYDADETPGEVRISYVATRSQQLAAEARYYDLLEDERRQRINNLGWSKIY